MIKKNKNKGILFWITGLSGAGKTSIAKKIKYSISKKYGSTLLVNGDDLRRIFNLNKYDKSSRLKYGIMFHNFAKFVTNQNINLIFAVVGLFEEIRNLNKKNINNYVEIYLKADIKNIKKNKKKKIYFNSKNKSIMGITIKPEFPKKPDIIIKNDFKKNIDYLSKKLLKKINL